MSFRAEYSRRWPVHPPLLLNESLSSWLCRVAAIYRLTVHDLLRLGMETVLSDCWLGLDFDHLPLEFFGEIERLTGICKVRMWQATYPGLQKLILGPGVYLSRISFTNYHSDFRVLTGPCPTRADLSQKAPRTKNYSVPWRLNPALVWDGPYRRRACGTCLREHGADFHRLLWNTPLVHSCPFHGTVLGDENSATSPPADTRLLLVDRITFEAVDSGLAKLSEDDAMPCQVWFRFLRGLVFELSHSSFYGTKKKYLPSILSAWEMNGLEPVQGNDYEAMSAGEQVRILTCVGGLIADWPQNLLRFVSPRYGAFSMQSAFLPFAIARHMHSAPTISQIASHSREFAWACSRLELEGAFDEFAYVISVDPKGADEALTWLVGAGGYDAAQARKILDDMRVERTRKYCAAREFSPPVSALTQDLRESEHAIDVARRRNMRCLKIEHSI